MDERQSLYGISPYCTPEKTITENEYRERLITLGKNKNLTYADGKFFTDLENLRNDLYDMIIYNTDEIEITGTKYYVSVNGNDNSDGLTPETAWNSLEKVAEYPFKEGDGVYFKRGDLWRGNTTLQSGVTYQAYGEGPKPKIFLAYDGINEAEWIQTENPDIWVFDKPLLDTDIGVIVFNGGEKYAKKQRALSEVKNELDFCHCGAFSNAEGDELDNKVYLYCEEGNPAKVFKEIDISRNDSVIKIEKRSHDITVHNLDVRYGRDYFFTAHLKNIYVSYCSFAWQGGNYMRKGWGRAGGGGGAWLECDGITMHHCFFTQQFDCAASPQFHGDFDTPCYLNNYSLHDCIIEYTEYSFEFFNTKKNGEDYGFNNMYLGYNIMRHCGEGFGDKHFASRHIKGWNHTNNCVNTLFEHNIFDRAHVLAIEYTGREPQYTIHNGGTDKVNYDLIPLLRNNMFIEPKNKPFANVNQIIYNFNETAQITLEKLGAANDDIYIFDGDYQNK